MKPNHETIYLVPTDYDGGQLTYSWCDCPAPGEGMREEDATRYVREDIYLALQAQVEQLKQFGAELLNQCEGLGKSNAIWRATGLAFGNIHYQDAAENLAACINKTPAKCLAENNVQVLESFDAFIEMTFPQEGVNFDTYLAALDMFREELRQQAKAGSNG